MSERSDQTMASDASLSHHPITWSVVRRLASYVLAYRAKLIVIILAIVVSAMAQAASALFLQSLVDTYILPLIGQSAPNWKPLMDMIAIMAAIYAVGVLSSWLWSRLIVDIDQAVMRTIRDEMFEHQQRLSLRFFDDNGYGDVMSRYTNDTDVLRSAIAWALPDVFASLMASITTFITMMMLSLPIAGIVAFFTAVLIVLVVALTRRAGIRFTQQQSELGSLNEYIEETVHGAKVIKVFNHEHAALQQFDACSQRVSNVSAVANSYANNVMPIVLNAGYVLYVLIAVIGAVAVSQHWYNIGLSNSDVLTLGTILSLIALSRSFINPIGEIAMQSSVIMMAFAGAARIFALLDEEPEIDDGSVQLVEVRVYEESGAQVADCQSCYRMQEVSHEKVDDRTICWAWKREMDDDGTRAFERALCLDRSAQELVAEAKREALTSIDHRYTIVRGDVRFTNVSFGYEPGETVLHDITWFAKPGQKIALVGATGAGKTTIAQLLTRFYEIDNGQILYDGIDVRDIRKQDLRHAVGTVLQDVSLFSGSIMDNIRYGRLNATDEECIEAAHLACADVFIEELSEGYETQLNNNGEGLSQGQKQLISIARAAVANPPVLILDEATSSIDTHTEALVQHGMDALMEGRTVFVIAHRLSTVRNADVIMVLDHGRIVERGSHDDLMALGGQYYQLYTGATELE